MHYRMGAWRSDRVMGDRMAGQLIWWRWEDGEYRGMNE